jgi:hypothetical protein
MNLIKSIENTMIRRMCKSILAFFKNKNFTREMIGHYYSILHHIIIGGLAIILLLSNNIIHLTIALVIVSLDAFANVVCHNCPLTALEEKYLGRSIARDARKKLKRASLLYKRNHLYESQLELLVNCWTMCVCKILVIMVSRFLRTEFWTM